MEGGNGSFVINGKIINYVCQGPLGWLNWILCDSFEIILNFLDKERSLPLEWVKGSLIHLGWLELSCDLFTVIPGLFDAALDFYFAWMKWCSKTSTILITRPNLFREILLHSAYWPHFTPACDPWWTVALPKREESRIYLTSHLAYKINDVSRLPPYWYFFRNATVFLWNKKLVRMKDKNIK